MSAPKRQRRPAPAAPPSPPPEPAPRRTRGRGRPSKVAPHLFRRIASTSKSTSKSTSARTTTRTRPFPATIPVRITRPPPPPAPRTSTLAPHTTPFIPDLRTLPPKSWTLLKMLQRLDYPACPWNVTDIYRALERRFEELRGEEEWKNEVVGRRRGADREWRAAEEVEGKLGERAAVEGGVAVVRGGRGVCEIVFTDGGGKGEGKEEEREAWWIGVKEEKEKK
ncbi:hypothetical protein EDC01DRAFT_778352 [Geopyxis carbonaria]|nr:hypothetical protein EDC01DRAFT_778352 [Geopyxis carbonaria]